MTVERRQPHRNPSFDPGHKTSGHGLAEPERAPLPRERPFLPQRTAVILTAALVAATAAGALAYLGPSRIAAAILAGGAAFGGAITLLNKLID